MRDGLLSAARQLGYQPAELKGPRLRHPAARRLWGWFCELAAARQVGQHGFQPVTWTEMAAWARLRGLALEPWEAQALRRLDGVFLRVSRGWTSGGGGTK